MSSGQIVIRKKAQYNNDIEKNIAEIVYQLIPTFEINVEDKKWEDADKSIKEEITALDEKQKEEIKKLDEKQKEDIKNLDNKIEDVLENKIKEIDKRLGDNQGNLSDEIKAIKKEIEDLKVRKPLDLIVKLDNSRLQDLGPQHCQLPTLFNILRDYTFTYT